MEDLGVKQTEAKIIQLLELVERLREENHTFRNELSVLKSERVDLMEKNENAKQKVEVILGRLREMEQEA